MSDYKKLHQDLRKAKQGMVREVVVPKQTYLVIKGTAAPDTESYSSAVGQLFALAYTIKFMPKKGVDIPHYSAGYPIGSLTATYGDIAKGWHWQMMIPQPDFVTDEVVKKAKKLLYAKGTPVKDIFVEQIEFGSCIQTLHVGPYNQERPAIELLSEYLQEHGREPTNHIEVYLNDPRKVSEHSIKTIIRYPYIISLPILE